VGNDDDQMPLFGRRPRPPLTPHRKVGSPGPPEMEVQGRDAALDLLSERRADLVEEGRSTAIHIAKQRGRVTSVEVFAQLRAYGYDAALDSADPRWMGVVFREDIWEREGFEGTGSHKRPVAIWKLRDPQNIPVSPRERIYRLVSGSGARGITVKTLAMNAGLKPSQVRTIVKKMEAGGKVMQLSARRGRVGYVLPEHHPDIV
jgi:hypothetical protein